MDFWMFSPSKSHGSILAKPASSQLAAGGQEEPVRGQSSSPQHSRACLEAWGWGLKPCGSDLRSGVWRSPLRPQLAPRRSFAATRNGADPSADRGRKHQPRRRDANCFVHSFIPNELCSSSIIDAPGDSACQPWERSRAQVTGHGPCSCLLALGLTANPLQRAAWPGTAPRAPGITSPGSQVSKQLRGSSPRLSRCCTHHLHSPLPPRGAVPCFGQPGEPNLSKTPVQGGLPRAQLLPPDTGARRCTTGSKRSKNWRKMGLQQQRWEK